MKGDGALDVERIGADDVARGRRDFDETRSLSGDRGQLAARAWIGRCAACKCDRRSRRDNGKPNRLQWRLLAQHPVCTYQTRTGRFEAIRLSDLIARRQLHRLELYAEAYRPAGIEYQLVAGISSSTRYTKTFLFHRSRPDFSERDRLVLDLLRPHLANLFRRFIERRSLAEVTSNLGTDLSTRELEVLRYVAKGYANAEVAGILWITTSTVRNAPRAHLRQARSQQPDGSGRAGVSADRRMRKSPVAGAFRVAGAGFEPATSGL